MVIGKDGKERLVPLGVAARQAAVNWLEARDSRAEYLQSIYMFPHAVTVSNGKDRPAGSKPRERQMMHRCRVTSLRHC